MAQGQSSTKILSTTASLQIVKLGARLTSARLEWVLGQLPSEEQERIRRYLHWEDSQRALLGALLVRSALSHHLGVSPRALTIRRNAWGRPFLADCENWKGDFNVTHSGQWVACGLVSTGKVGIDLEQVTNLDHALPESCFSPAERSALETCPSEELNLQFFRLWALKESVVKAQGTGLSFPLQSFSVQAFQTERPCLSLDGIRGDPMSGWRLCNYRLEGYGFAWCSDLADPPDPVELAQEDVLGGAFSPCSQSEES